MREHPPSRPEGAARVLLKHQLGAIIATLIDFAVMIGLVSGAGMLPAVGTAVGAAAGAVTNFVLGRHWIFRARGGNRMEQAQRYALVSFASLLLNSGGEHVLATLMRVDYIGARVVVAAAVSLLWNFPMHRHFVFRAADRRR